MTDVLAGAMRSWPQPFLISWNIANQIAAVTNPHPAVSLFNFHYAAAPFETVALNWGLQKAIGDNETGFRGTNDAPYRIEAWHFILSGGALFNHLDYSFTVGHENGTHQMTATTPGGGSPALRRQFGILRDFINDFRFVRMQPDHAIIKGGLPTGVSARVLAEPGRACAVYLHKGGAKGATTGPVNDVALQVDLPAGRWRAAWVDTKNGQVVSRSDVTGGALATLEAPAFDTDIALRIVKR
jgi:hypothetical protein